MDEQEVVKLFFLRRFDSRILTGGEPPGGRGSLQRLRLLLLSLRAPQRTRSPDPRGGGAPGAGGGAPGAGGGATGDRRT